MSTHSSKYFPGVEEHKEEKTQRENGVFGKEKTLRVYLKLSNLVFVCILGYKILYF